MPTRANPVGDLDKQVAQVLRSLRGQRGVSDLHLASVTGLSGPTIGRIMRGEKAITIDLLYQLADELGASPVDVLRAAEAPSGEVVHLAVPPAQPPAGARTRRRRAAAAETSTTAQEPSPTE